MPGSSTPPGEGERRAQRGYTSQYNLSAAAIYQALNCGDLEWIGVADRTAGIVDDVVLGLSERVIGHQYKISQFPAPFQLRTLLTGASGLLLQLATGWQSLRCGHPAKEVEIRLVTNDYPSTRDKLLDDSKAHSAAFLVEFDNHSNQSLSDWRTTKWEPLINDLCSASGLDELEFDSFLQSLKILHGSNTTYLQTHLQSPGNTRLVGEIAALLPRLVADARDKDRWTRAELLQELGWRDSALAHHVHHFPVGSYVQRNKTTELALRDVIQRNTCGYVSLVGSPGAGKSTLLQVSLESEQDTFLVRYLAFVPDTGQGVGRGEADDFFDDIVSQLKRTGLRGLRNRDQSLHERREQFNSLLNEAGERFTREGIRTLVVIDGLDHVPREEQPQRSFLAELPLPGSVPDGVLFVLGTQRINLDDLKPAVQDQAGSPARKVVVAPLSREAVHRISDLLHLDQSVDRDSVFDQSRGHPLVTRYLIEALRESGAADRDALLAGEMRFAGDIETVYESAWRCIRDDEEARTVLDFLARTEGPMQLELLVQSLTEPAIERALKATKHLLTKGQHGWNVFHNSFRLFILAKPRLRLGEVDQEYGKRLYRELATLARSAQHDSPQCWLELRYLARAEEHASVLALATPIRFRQQFAEHRSYFELRSDLRLAFASAKCLYDPLKIFQLLLIQDEIARRWSAYESSSAFVEALLHVGDLDGAVAFVEQAPTQGYEVVDALLEAGEFSRAHALFDQLEPLQQILNGTSSGHLLDISGLREWAWRVIHFRNDDQILQAIPRLSKSAMLPGFDTSESAVEDLESDLRREVAKAIVTERDDIDIVKVGQQYGIDVSMIAQLMVDAGIASAERGAVSSAVHRFREAIECENFKSVNSPSRRRAALIAAKNGNLELAEELFKGLQSPEISNLEDTFSSNDAEYIVRAVLEHAELAAMIGGHVAAAPTSRHQFLRPLQLHLEAIGRILGLAHLDPSRLNPGEITRAAHALMTYFDHVQPSVSESYMLRHVEVASSALCNALVQAAERYGKEEFTSTIAELDQALSKPYAFKKIRTNLKQALAIGIYFCTGDTDEASRRLDQLVGDVAEDTPTGQIEELANFSILFAKVGNVARAQELLALLPNESLGYELPPKKDAQYAIWCELLKYANEVDEGGRSDRVAFLMRQITGMMHTEGYSAAHRIAPTLLKQAAMCDAQTAWRAGQLLVKHDVVGWALLVDSILIGLVTRRPDLVWAIVVTWCELVLPYYMEPYYSEDKLGSFIETSIDAASSADVQDIVATFLAAIETESRAHERSALLNRLCRAANAYNAWNQHMESARLRWQAESPPPRHSYTPDRYDGISSLLELQKIFEQDATRDGKLNYEAAYAFIRLAPHSDFVLAKEIFDRWDSIQNNSRARFLIINMAIDSGRRDVAVTLMDDYQREGDDHATWSEWSGSGLLRYFKTKLRLEGANVHREAYNDLVEALSAGRESTSSILLNHAQVFRILTDSPDWVGMWEALKEQLTTTREHALGSAFERDDSSELSDEELIASLFSWALTLPLSELRRHSFSGALRIGAIEEGQPIFVQLVNRLLAGTDDEPADGIQILLLDTSDAAASEFEHRVRQLTDHADYAVAESAAVLARRWGITPSRKKEALSDFYSLILEDGERFEQPQLVDPASGAMLVEDPLGWTYMFENQIKLMACSGVSVAHIRHRCRMYIKKWGGLDKFGKAATERLQVELRRLEMKIPFARPHLTVASRALRYVAGELLRAGVIPKSLTQMLLHEQGYPAPQPALPIPTLRPSFIHRPLVDDTNWQAQGEDWLDRTAEDTIPLETGSDAVIVEVFEFNIRNSCRLFHMRRVRAPGLELGYSDRNFDGFERLPLAIWLNQIEAASEEPAATIARRLMVSSIPETPQYRLVICPHWLRKLGWRTNLNDEHIYLDREDNLVARTVWWRDGGPVDIEDKVIWGQGSYLSLTPSGRQQVEALIGPLDVRVYARRSYISGPSDSDEESRFAESKG